MGCLSKYLFSFTFFTKKIEVAMVTRKKTTQTARKIVDIVNNVSETERKEFMTI